MPKISDERREQRRDQILDAALRCFAERGFQATSMADIISASGLSAGALYLYFAGKWDIAQAVARRVMEGPLTAALDRPDSGGGPPGPAGVIRAIGAGLDRHGIPPGFVVQIWGEAATDPEFRGIPDEVFTMLQSGFAGMLERWFASERGCSDAEARSLARDQLPVMLALAQGYMLQRALMPGFDEARYLAAVERVFTA